MALTRGKAPSQEHGKRAAQLTGRIHPRQGTDDGSPQEKAVERLPGALESQPPHNQSHDQPEDRQYELEMVLSPGANGEEKHRRTWQLRSESLEEVLELRNDAHDEKGREAQHGGQEHQRIDRGGDSLLPELPRDLEVNSKPPEHGLERPAAFAGDDARSEHGRIEIAFTQERVGQRCTRLDPVPNA